MKSAEHSLEQGNEFPYDAGEEFWKDESQENVSPPKPVDWAHAVARGVLADLQDRRGIKWELNKVAHEDRKTLVEMIAEIIRVGHRNYSEPPQEPQWIVNSQGELGVHVNEQFYFMYKGENIQYGKEDSRNGSAVQDDGEIMQYRLIGKREFGEVVHPIGCLKTQEGFHIHDTTPKRYTKELAYIPGLSFGKPEDTEWKWKPLPAAKP